MLRFRDTHYISRRRLESIREFRFPNRRRRQNEDRGLLVHSIHWPRLPLLCKHYAQMLSIVEELIGLHYCFVRQNHGQNRSGAIDILIRRKPVPAEVFAPSTRWNKIVECLTEVLHGE
jgi:hypothetical protein